MSAPARTPALSDRPPARTAAVPAGGAALHGAAAGLRYGLLGLPLAFVALPLYVLLPNHYAAAFGMPLGLLGGLLLATRLVDALADPWIGRAADRLFAQSPRRAWTVAALAAFVLGAAFTGLFFPPVQGRSALLAWAAAMLVLAYLGYSTVGVIHNAWGARLGGDAPGRARVVAWREGAALIGVVVASVLPSLAGLQAMTAVFLLALALGIGLLARAPQPQARRAASAQAVPLGLPWRVPAFRRLMQVFVLNGIASALPATLVLFFIRDRLQAPAWEPAFLAAYFLAGALSIPAWVRAVARLGLARAWQLSMGLAIAAFSGAALLGTGDTTAFLIVCLASGLALGADLTLPAALLAGLIQRAGHGDRAEGAYFGWWAFATKLNLALAAGLALPLLGLLGYAPGAREPAALGALTLAYCLLPCLLKLLAAAALQRLIRLDEKRPAP